MQIPQLPSLHFEKRAGELIVLATAQLLSRIHQRTVISISR
jgi:hypothetical protein